MKIINYCVVMLLIGSFSGCSWISSKQQASTQSSQFVTIEQITDQKRLKKGGKILVVPFKAGVDVIATEELDKIALMIVQGLAQRLKDHEAFEVLTADNADEAELIIRGYITSFQQPSKVKKWVMRSKKIQLGVEGKMIDLATGHTVLIFEDSRESIEAGEDHKKLGRTIGQNIGQFILSGLK